MQATQSLLKTIFNLHNSKEKDKIIALISEIIIKLGYRINWKELEIGQGEVKFVHLNNPSNYAIVRSYTNDSLMFEEYEMTRNARAARIISKTMIEGDPQIENVVRREAIVGNRGLVLGLIEVMNKKITFYGKEKILEWLNCAPITNQVAWQNLNLILSLEIPETILPDEAAPIMETESLERNIEEYKTFVSECKQRYMIKNR